MLEKIKDIVKGNDLCVLKTFLHHRRPHLSSWGPSAASANRTHFRKRFLQSSGNKIEKDSPPPLWSNWKVSSIRSFLNPNETGTFPWPSSI